MEENRDSNEMETVFKVLVNQERLKIVGVLAVEKLNAGQIAERLGMQSHEVQRQVSSLEHIGLVRVEAGVYRLDVEELNAIARRVLAGTRQKVSVDDFEGEEFDRKVLKDYMLPGGRLKQIPTQQKKLLVILRYLASKFEPGTHYSEKEVNMILAQVYPDSASLRRYLVDERFLERQSGVYWRVAES